MHLITPNLAIYIYIQSFLYDTFIRKQFVFYSIFMLQNEEDELFLLKNIIKIINLQKINN